MAIGYRKKMTQPQIDKFNAAMFLGKEFMVAQRLNAIELTSTGAQEIRWDDSEEAKYGTGTGSGDTVDYDVKMLFDETNLEMLPRTDDLAAFNIGDGTTDMDFKVFTGDTSNYFQTNVDTTGSAGQSGASGGKVRVRTTEAALLATGAYAGIYSTWETTITQSNNTSCFAMWGELYITGDIRFHTNAAGVWGHLEIMDAGGSVYTGTSGTATAPAGFTAGVAASVVTSDGYTCESDHVICGLRTDSGIHASATLTGWSVGLEVSKTSSGKAWTAGIRMLASACTTGIYMMTMTTGINLAGTMTTGIVIGDGVTTDISFDACTTGLSFGGLVSGTVLDYTTTTSVGETTTAHLIRYGTSSNPIVYTPTTGGSHSGIQMHMTAADAPTGLSLAAVRAYVTYTGTAKATAYGGLFWVNLNTDSYTGDYIGGTPAGVQGVLQIEGTVESANEHAWYCGVAGEVRPLGTVTKVGVISGLRAVMNCTASDVTAGVLVGVHVGVYSAGTIDAGVLVMPHVGCTVTRGLHLDSQYGTITTGIVVGTTTTGMTIGTCTGHGILITNSDGTGSMEEIHVNSEFTATGAVAHKAILAECSYTPASAGGSVPIAIAGMTDLAAGKTHNALYMWGVQGGLKFNDDSVVSGSQYAAGRFVLEEGSGTITYTSGNIAGIYIDNLITSPMASESSGQIDLMRIANHGGLMDNAINLYGPNLTNLFYLGGCTTAGCVTATAASAVHGTLTKKIAISIDGVTYYLLASTTPTT